MKAYLLDVNVLVALAWPAHSLHALVHEWFVRHSRRGWATCAITQAGFVRVVSNPAFSRDALTPRQASQILSDNIKHRAHRFWSMNDGYTETVETFSERVVGHQQVTDAYLVGLVMRQRGRLATLDAAIRALLPEHLADEFIEVIG